MTTIRLPLDLGVVDPLDAEEVCDWILTPRADLPGPRILANLNLHAVHLALDDGPVKKLTSLGDVVLIDGWPILQLARLAAPRQSRPTARARTGSSDWLAALIDRDPDILVLSVGGTLDTATKVPEYIAENTKHMRWRAFDGYDFVERGAVRDSGGTLHDLLKRADVVLVGMGMPTQEAWILDHLSAAGSATVVANVGGCLDYFVGTQPLAPRWMGAAGLEWLYRLARSPRRLAGRYLAEPLILCARLVPRAVRAVFAKPEKRDDPHTRATRPSSDLCSEGTTR